MNKFVILVILIGAGVIIFPLLKKKIAAMEKQLEEMDKAARPIPPSHSQPQQAPPQQKQNRDQAQKQNEPLQQDQPTPSEQPQETE